MPDRDYYLLKDKDSAATRDAYKQVPRQPCWPSPACMTRARSAAVYALEERIAHAHWPAAERRDADKIYNPMSLAALAKLAPQFPWDAYLAAAGVSRRSPRGERVVVVREKSAFPKLAALFAATPVARVARLSDGALPALACELSARRKSTTPTSPSTAR